MRGMTLWLRAWVLAALLGAGCRDEQAGPRHRPPPLPPPLAAQAPAAVPRLLDAAPEDLTFTSGATWAGGAVVYLGSRVVPPKGRPGESLTVSHFFRATALPPHGYRFFAHVVEPATGRMLMNADHEIQGGAMPLERWPVGKVIEDTTRLPLPRITGQIRLVLGFWQGDQRLGVDDAAAHDGENRMLGPLVDVEDTSPLPEYRARKVSKPPAIDGDLADATWTQATPVDLVNSLDGQATSVRTTARLAYDDAHLYVAFDCEDPDIWGTFQKRDEPLYTQEVVEVFLDANADGRTYNELEVSPGNVVFDAYFPARRQGMDLSYDSGMKTAVRVRGTLNDGQDRDQGWTVEMQIPLARLAEVPHVPPRRGERWRFNLYRLEGPSGRQVEGQAFSPLFIGDFHHLPRFGWLVFE